MVQPGAQPHARSAPIQASELGERESLGRTPRFSAWKIGALGVMIIVIGLGFSAFLRLVIRPVALLFAAIIVAEALSPLIDRMSRRLPRTLAVVVPYAGLLAVIGGGSWLVYPMLVDEAQNLVDQGPELVNQFQAWLEDVDPTGG
ncbi:MAG: AI-2E family transporter, partial [Chloroflexota bacterium]|nr:AI-2E family transporter [Chloroflexota bacterium]